jgi:hypothetical protein
MPIPLQNDRLHCLNKWLRPLAGTTNHLQQGIMQFRTLRALLQVLTDRLAIGGQVLPGGFDLDIAQKSGEKFRTEQLGIGRVRDLSEQGV